MKKIFINSLIAASLLIVAGSCKKEINYKADRTFVDPTNALLKINYGSAYALNPSVQLSINGERVSGLITGRTPFPGGGYNTNGSNFPDYLVVKPGANILKISIPKKLTNVDSVVLFTGNLTLDSGKNYTAHVTDTLANTKMVVLQDNMTFANLGYSKYRFVNMMPNVSFIDLYYGTVKVADAIPYLGNSPYFYIAVPATALTWSIRETGTSPTSTALATYISSNTHITQRVYTAFAMGYKGSAATTTKPYVSFFLSR